jgi:hypothetical protein
MTRLKVKGSLGSRNYHPQERFHREFIIEGLFPKEGRQNKQNQGDLLIL